MARQEWRISGALFESENPRGPAFTGVIKIDGEEHQIACWPKTSQAGKNYLQISENKKNPRTGGGGSNNFTQKPSFGSRVSMPKNPDDDMNDDIPFISGNGIF